MSWRLCLLGNAQRLVDILASRFEAEPLQQCVSRQSLGTRNPLLYEGGLV
jgi:hypothetical protein